jgi:transcriptional regulator with XRE-family HTH domain
MPRGMDRAAQERRAIETRLPNPWGTEGIGLLAKRSSQRSGLDRSYLGGVERGERNVTFGVLCAICVGLECDIPATTKCIPHATPVFRFSEGSISVSSRNGKGPGELPEPSS